MYCWVHVVKVRCMMVVRSDEGESFKAVQVEGFFSIISQTGAI